MERNVLYPVFLKVNQLQVLIVGGGNVAEEKLRFLLKSSPNATVHMISPMYREATLTLAKKQKETMLKGKNFPSRKRKSFFHDQDENAGPAQAIKRFTSKNLKPSKKSRASLMGHNNDTQTKFFSGARKSVEPLGWLQGRRVSGPNTYDLLQEFDPFSSSSASKKAKIRVNIPNKKKIAKDFFFEKIFREKSTQQDVFCTFEKVLIDNCLNGVRIEGSNQR